MAQIDVIIPTRNRGFLIAGTLQSLQASNFSDFHVWIADQSTNSETANAVAELVGTDARFTYLYANTQGSNRGRNLGLQFSNAPLVAFTDDDCRVDPDWLGKLVSEYDQDSRAWAVFGQILPDTNSSMCQKEERLRQAIPIALKGSMERKVFEGNRFNLGFGHGANMSFRRVVFTCVGPFDELLGTGAPLRAWPERDLGYRILVAGGRIIYTPEARVTHCHWRSWDEVRKTYRNYAIGTGAAVIKYWRHGDRKSLLLLGEWLWSQGVRQMASGLFKWHSWQKVVVGALQLVYPFWGIWHGLRYPISKEYCIYQWPRKTGV